MYRIAPTHRGVVDVNYAFYAMPIIWLVPLTIRNSRVITEGEQRYPCIIVLK